MEESFDKYIFEANQAAVDGNWAKTLECLLLAFPIQPSNVELLTAIGGTYLQLGRIEDALPYFKKVIELMPDSGAAYQNLAGVYQLMGRWREAEQAFRQAVELDDEDRLSWKGLARVCLQQGKAQEGVEILAALVKSNSEDTEAMVMLGECYEEAGEDESARWLYEMALTVDREYQPASAGLERIRQRKSASSVNKEELARKLAKLKKAAASVPALSVKEKQTDTTPQRLLRLAIFGPPLASVEVRLGPVAQCLMRVGHSVRIATKPELLSEIEESVVLFSHPHDSEALSGAVLGAKEKGLKVVLDLEEDFLTSQQRSDRAPEMEAEGASRLKKLMPLADVVTTSNDALAKTYAPYARHVAVVPYSYDETNPLWKKAAPKRSRLQVGLVSGHSHPSDLTLLREVLPAVLKDFPGVLVGVVADFPLYQALEYLPEERKFFLPPGRLDDYPYLLANFDILLFPLAEAPLNHSRSDLPLLEAGARGIPWIATPIPAFEQWGEGGIFARSAMEWETGLHTLLQSTEAREKLAQAGARKAQERSSDSLRERWVEILS
ncbi:MAG: tetratricopeptide repeat protein [Chloroflexota bacterium]